MDTHPATVPPPLTSDKLQPSQSRQHKTDFISAFVREQRLHTKTHTAEGLAFFASWDRLAPDIPSTPSKVDSTPVDMGFGFGTPVLKPRVAAPTQSSPIIGPPEKAKNASAGPNQILGKENTTSKAAAVTSPPAVHANVPKGKSTARSLGAKPESPKRKSAPSPKRNAKSTSKKAILLDKEPETREMEISSTAKGLKRKSGPSLKGKAKATTKDTALSDEERVARLTERRDRKRATRAKMKPKEVVISDEDDDSVVSGSDAVVKKKRKKEKERKNKVLAGMALINGFTAANIGRGRLTVKPSNVGVFGRGKASTKVTVKNRKTGQKGRHQNYFSEHEFLSRAHNDSKRTARRRISTSSSVSSSDSSTLPVHPFAPCVASSGHSTPPRKRVALGGASSSKTKTKTGGGKHIGTKVNEYAPPQKTRRKSVTSEDEYHGESEIWDIELTDSPVPDPEPSIVKASTVILDTRPFGLTGRQDAQVSADTDSTRELKEQHEKTSGAGSLSAGQNQSSPPTLGPSDSASRCAEQALLARKLPSTKEAVSRYFSSNAGVGVALPAVALPQLPGPSLAARMSLDLPVEKPEHLLQAFTECSPAQIDAAIHVEHGHNFIANESFLLPAFSLHNPEQGAPAKPSDTTQSEGFSKICQESTDGPSSPNSLEAALQQYEVDKKGPLQAVFLLPSTTHHHVDSSMARETTLAEAAFLPEVYTQYQVGSPVAGEAAPEGAIFLPEVYEEEFDFSGIPFGEDADDLNTYHGLDLDVANLPGNGMDYDTGYGSNYGGIWSQSAGEIIWPQDEEVEMDLGYPCAGEEDLIHEGEYEMEIWQDEGNEEGEWLDYDEWSAMDETDHAQLMPEDELNHRQSCQSPMPDPVTSASSELSDAVSSDELDTVRHFSQGRDLLLLGTDFHLGEGACVPPLPRRVAGNAVTRVEAAVAKRLRDHWRPQRL